MKEEDIEIEEKEVSISPHLSLTHMQIQDGAANGRNVSLLMKSDLSSLTDRQIHLLKSIVGAEEIEKTSSRGKRKALQEALSNINSEYCVLDFDDEIVVFEHFSYDGYYIYASEYSIRGNKAILSGNIRKVNEVVSYENESGSIVLSEKIDEDISADVLSLIKSSLPTLNGNKKVRDVFKTKYEEGVKLMKEEIQKAVDAALSPMKEELQKAQTQLAKAVEEREKAEAALQELAKSVEASKQAARLDKLKEVIADKEQAEALQKSLAEVSDEIFEQVFKSLQSKNEVIESSGLFCQSSTETDSDAPQESYTAKLLKQKYAS